SRAPRTGARAPRDARQNRRAAPNEPAHLATKARGRGHFVPWARGRGASATRGAVAGSWHLAERGGAAPRLLRLERAHARAAALVVLKTTERRASTRPAAARRSKRARPLATTP